MRNVTITLREDVADWLRVEAAKSGASMSAFVAGLLEERWGAARRKRLVGRASRRLGVDRGLQAFPHRRYAGRPVDRRDADRQPFLPDFSKRLATQ